MNGLCVLIPYSGSGAQRYLEETMHCFKALCDHTERTKCNESLLCEGETFGKTSDGCRHDTRALCFPGLDNVVWTLGLR